VPSDFLQRIVGELKKNQSHCRKRQKSCDRIRAPGQARLPGFTSSCDQQPRRNGRTQASRSDASPRRLGAPRCSKPHAARSPTLLEAPRCSEPSRFAALRHAGKISPRKHGAFCIARSGVGRVDAPADRPQRSLRAKPFGEAFSVKPRSRSAHVGDQSIEKRPSSDKRAVQCFLTDTAVAVGSAHIVG